MTTPNKDLTDHKLLIITEWDLPPGYRDSLKAKYPGLEVVHSKVNPWKDPTAKTGPDSILGATAEDWATATVALTGKRLPQKVGQAPRLRFVQLRSAGANYVLENPLFRYQGVPFCTANGVAGSSIAEWVICTYLAFQHRIPHYLDNMRDGNFETNYDELDTLDVVKQRVGILGYGSIGRQVARVATAMGMEVYAYTNRPKPTPESRRDDAYCPPGLGDPEGTLPARWFSGTTPAELNAFLGSGLDLLVVALPLTPETECMLGMTQFKILGRGGPTDEKRKRKTFISNVGRGATIITKDLVTALEKGWIRGAALDVTDPEPLPAKHPLWKRKDVIITPHVSGNTDSYFERLLDILDINLARLAEGRTDFVNLVSRKRGY